MDDLIGRTLLHFRVLDRIGAGAMGVVYRARDEQLRRDVAIKVLPTETLSDESARKRFRHEALTLSRLNHPNIETVFGFETQDGLDLLIVEYVEGLSLEDRLGSSPMPEDEAISLAMGIAAALDAAHSKGVIHCDLKPANVGVTPDGRVKVLDFGVAQVLRGQPDETVSLSTLGAIGIGGTLPYMAPEQLLGKRIDGRVDLYALGVLLFRTVAGRVPFCQPVPAALMDDILHKPPPSPRTLNPAVSARLEGIILRCLEKDPAVRYQTAADLRADLGRLQRDLELAALGGAPVDARARVPAPRRRRSKVVIAGMASLGALALIWLVASRQHPLLPFAPSDRQVTFTGLATDPAISPDGQYAAYVDHGIRNEQRLFVQDLAGGEPLQVFSARACVHPCWSPDGSTILSEAVHDSVEAAVLVPKLGGTPRSLPSDGPIHSWAPDGRRFVSAASQTGKLLITDTATGDTTSLALEGLPDRVLDLDWSPRGDRIVVLATDDHGLYSFWSVRPGHAGAQKWFEDSVEVFSPRCSNAGDAVYFLRAARQAGLKDLCTIRWPDRPRHSARPEVLIRGLAAGDYFTMSRDGRRLLHTRDVALSNLRLADLGPRRAGVDNGGRSLTTGTSYDESPAISPDGQWVAFVREAGPSAEIFRIPIDGGKAQRLTFMNSVCRSPVWSPSGDTIAFVSDKGGLRRLWRVAAKGGPARPYSGIEVSDHPLAPLAWAPGAALLYATAGTRDYRLLDTRTGRTTVLGTSDSLGWVAYPQLSRDGARLAWWTPDPRGMWIMTLADRARIRVVRDGPVFPSAWSADGRWVYAADWRATKPRVVRFSGDGRGREVGFEIPISESVGDVSVSPDGSRAVCVVVSQHPDIWLAEGFDRRVK